MTKSEKTKQFIIEQTAVLFNQKGYFATTMTDITSVTGLTKGGIYGNFENKDELALQVFNYNCSLLAGEINEHISRFDTAYSKMMAIITLYKQKGLQRFETGGCPMMNATVEACFTTPYLQPNVKKAFKIWTQILESVITLGVKNSEFVTSSPKQYAITFAALIQGGLIMSKASGSATELTTALNRVKTIMDTELVTQ